MTIQEAINLQNELMKYCIDMDYTHSDYTSACDEILELNVMVCEALEKQIWVSTKERLPNDMEIVNITWVNRNPPPYYADIKDVPQVATGLVMNGEWYWFSCYSENIAEFEYLADADKMDKDIEVVAWLPLPSPYKECDTE